MSGMNLTPGNVSPIFAIYHNIWHVCCLSETTSSDNITSKVSFSAPTLWNHGACFGLFILCCLFLGNPGSVRCMQSIQDCTQCVEYPVWIVYFYCSGLSSSLSNEGIGEWRPSVPVLHSEKNWLISKTEILLAWLSWEMSSCLFVQYWHSLMLFSERINCGYFHETCGDYGEPAVQSSRWTNVLSALSSFGGTSKELWHLETLI